MYTAGHDAKRFPDEMKDIDPKREVLLDMHFFTVHR